eukprot:3478473-Prymnesium_polylepis.1
MQPDRRSPPHPSRYRRAEPPGFSGPHVVLDEGARVGSSSNKIGAMVYGLREIRNQGNCNH